MKISAFVGHSFSKQDAPVVNEILRGLNAIKKTLQDFDWDHAEDPETKDLRDKVLAKIEGKNLFIGICTAKEKVIDLANLRFRFFDRDSLWAKKTAFESKTSDWIIQEIGLAVGRNMDLILLIEDGVRRPGGLQGNVEYISFSRAAVSESFPKLAEMIASIRPRPALQLAHIGASEKGDSQEAKVPPESEKKLVPQPDWTKDDFLSALFQVIFDKNEEAEKVITDAFMACSLAQNQTDLADFKSFRIDVHHFCGKPDVAKDMLALAKEYPENSTVLVRLARIYDSDRQPEQSAKIYADLFAKASTNKDKVSHGTISAIKHARLGNFTVADTHLALLDRLENLTSQEEAEVLEAKARVSLAKGDDLLFCALVEGSLFRDPENSDLRFEVARKYEELNHSSLAMKHYLVLCNKKPTETNWNNLGVAYQRLNLSGPSVDAYLKSKELKGTLAVSNLAALLVNAGFYNQAEQWCREALKIEGCDERVGSALGAIERSREKDQKEETAELKKARVKVDFFCDISTAAIGYKLKDGIYSFKDKKGIYELKVSGDKFHGAFEYDVPQNNLAGLFNKSLEQVKKYRVTLSGRLVGMSGVYTREMEEQTGSILTAERKTTKGVLLFAADGSKISLYDAESGEIVDHLAISTN